MKKVIYEETFGWAKPLDDEGMTMQERKEQNDKVKSSKAIEWNYVCNLISARN